MQITDIDAKINTAIYYLERTIDEIEKEANNTEIFPREISLSDTSPNFVKAAFQLAELIQKLRNLKKINRLFRINDSLKEAMFQNYLNDNETRSIIITDTYTVRDVDNLTGIGLKFGVDWKKIADYNNLDSSELTAGTEIEIPREIDPRLILEYSTSKSPVFDLPEGERVLGTDLPNELEINSVTGDLNVLNYRETFKQGMNNIANTNQGEYPFWSNFGLDSVVGDDIPRDVYEDWLKIKIQNSFLNDSRVFEVPVDEIEITRNGESLSAEVNIYPVRGLSFESIILELYYK